eukprot:TRINITY_DN48735_c0_g1_i1.p1 TRINITY_DN48735_c0_g1~~TRINITY_DN48735_c0_g1_i1.p1  ORF type:complete len:196 (-),score=24.20 TRINITY_DN48735_c0_g1_i1:491-1078(-)
MALENYVASWSEYLSLLKSPEIDGYMFSCSGGNEAYNYQRWNVLNFFFSFIALLVYCGYFMYYCFRDLSQVDYLRRHALANLWHVTSIAIWYFLANLLSGHFRWFIVVKQAGCCGAVGYLIIGLVYLLELGYVGQLFNVYSWHGIGLVYLILLIPSIFMAKACFCLVRGGNKTVMTRGIVLEEDEESGESGSSTE